MNYADIIKALPTDVAAKLQSHLDMHHIDMSMSPDEVHELIEDAVKLTRLEVVIHDDEKRRMVDGLLTMVAGAATKAIFA